MLGQVNGKGATLSKLTLKANVTTQQAAQLLDNREPQTGSFVFSRQILLLDRRRSLAESLENDDLIIKWNTNSGVRNDRVETVILSRVHRNMDASPFRRELDGIRQQVE